MKKLYSVIHFFVILIAAGALNAQTVTVSPNPVTLSAAASGVAQQVVTINSTGSTPASVILSSNAPWLKINNALATSAMSTPASVTVTADATGMFPNTYQAAIFVTVVGGTNFSVPVVFTVSSIGVSPSAVTFTYQNNGIVPNPVPLNLTSPSNITFSAVATTTSGGNWLVVPATGTSPGTLPVSLNTNVVAPGMAPGTYNGTVTLTPSNGAPAVSVPVTLTVTTAPTVTANPSSVQLNYQSNGASGPTNTPAQTLTLTNPGATDLSYLISPTSTPAGWLSVSPTNGTIPANGSVQVTVSYVIGTATPGAFNGTLTIFVANAANSQFTVPVRLLIATTPLINVQSGNSLAFSFQIGGAQPASKPVLVTSTAVAADATSGQMPMIINATTSSGGSWLIVPPSGVTGTPFNVTVIPTGLAVGTYNGTVSVTGVGATNGPQTIPVTLTVSNDPLLVAAFGGCSSAFTTCPLNFAIQTGQNSPTTQNVRVTTSTGATASFTAAVSMTANTACGNAWLSSGVTAAVVSNDVTFPISVTPGSIASGTTCTGTVTITGINPTTGAALPNSPVTIPVTMFVSNSAMFVANPIALNFTVGLNGATFQTLNVTSTGSADLGFQASALSGVPWLVVSTASHVTSAGQVTVAVNAAGLTPGTYGSSVAITSTAPGVLNSPLIVPVTLTVTGATMSVTPNTLSFTQTLGATAPAAKTVSVATSGADITFNTAVSMTEGAGWLTATPASATATLATPATVTINANGSTLAPGTYHGTVTIASTSPLTSGSPATVAVILEVKPGTLAATPASLSFAQVQNGPAPASQKITVTGTPGPLAFTVTTSTNNNSGNWITVTPASGNTPSDVSVTVNGASLQPGDYTGKVTITSAGATGSPIDIPVSLKVSTSATLTVSQGTVNLTYVIGMPGTPQIPAVQLTASGPGVTFTTTTTVSGGGNWLSVTPTSGTAPAALTIAVNPTGLAAGDFTGTININSPNSATQPATSITVKLTVLAVPKPVAAAVQNAASAIVGAVSPGENIVIYGSGLGPATLAPYHITNNVFDTTVANTRVLFDGVPAPILYVWEKQTSVMVPYFVARGPSTTMVIEYLGVQSNPVTLSVTSTAPGIYTLNQAGSGQGAIVNQNGTINAAASPAPKSTAVAVYMTGEGTTTPASVDGGIAALNGTPLAKPILPVTATVGGVPATVEYYGSAPSIIYGVMQVNVRIPSNAPSGPNVPIVVTVGTTPSQGNVTIAIQ